MLDKTWGIMAGYICSDCGYGGGTRVETKGSLLVEIVLWLCFFIPGLIYSLWRLSSRSDVCAKCGAHHLIPLDSPKGKELAKQYPDSVLAAEQLAIGSATLGYVWMGVIALIIMLVLFLNYSG